MQTLIEVAVALTVLALLAAMVAITVVSLIYCKGERWTGFAVAVMVLIGAGIVSFVTGILGELGLPKVWAGGISAAAFGVGAVMTGSLAYGFFESAMDERHGTKCARCGQRGSVQVRTRSDSYDTTMTETRRVTHYSADRDVTGYSEHEVEVPAVHTTTTYTYTCGACGHSWTR